VEWGAERRTGPSRVPGDPIVGTMNDFVYVIEALFAERDAQAQAYMEASADQTQPLQRPATSILNSAKEIWALVFPDRQLVLGDYQLQIQPPDPAGRTYSATQLSDGERVGLYLISHALLAPKNATLLIDEPELHLHESLQASLWNAIETARPDCNFVYITHNLEFAASRVGAPKVLLRSYSMLPSWEWELAPEEVGLPEDVVLRIVGARKPTLFVEGQAGSIDQDLYQAAYPNFYIVPSEGCERVIRSAQAFRAHESLHRYHVRGIIDRDDRDAAEVRDLMAIGVHVLLYAQAENILAAREAMAAYSEYVHHPPAETATRSADAEQRVLQLLTRERAPTIAQRATYGVERRLHKISPSGTSASDLIAAVNAASVAADPANLYRSAEALVDGIIASAVYEDALSVLRNRGVLPAVAQAMGTSPREYRRIVLALVRENRSLLSRVLPTL